LANRSKKNWSAVGTQLNSELVKKIKTVFFFFLLLSSLKKGAHMEQRTMLLLFPTNKPLRLVMHRNNSIRQEEQKAYCGLQLADTGGLAAAPGTCGT
jgi:hypothetical protein